MRAVFCALVLCACQGAAPDLPTAEVVRGDFAVTHVEGGEVRAASGEVVASPRIGGRLKIIHLWPEGEQVDVGDLILQFDPAEFEREMLDREGQLEQAHSDFTKAKAEEERQEEEKRKAAEARAKADEDANDKDKDKDKDTDDGDSNSGGGDETPDTAAKEPDHPSDDAPDEAKQDDKQDEEQK